MKTRQSHKDHGKEETARTKALRWEQASYVPLTERKPVSLQHREGDAEGEVNMASHMGPCRPWSRVEVFFLNLF